jgi:hypothetical protein
MEPLPPGCANDCSGSMEDRAEGQGPAVLFLAFGDEFGQEVLHGRFPVLEDPSRILLDVLLQFARGHGPKMLPERPLITWACLVERFRLCRLLNPPVVLD